MSQSQSQGSIRISGRPNCCVFEASRRDMATASLDPFPLLDLPRDELELVVTNIDVDAANL